VRAVLDPNVVISGLLSPTDSPAQILQAWERGEFELLVCRALTDELARALAYPKLRRHVSADEADAVVSWLSRSANSVANPQLPPTVRSADPADDYLVALAETQRAVLVSGDAHLLDLSAEIPVRSPRDFLELLTQQR
jgi:putative PIN family toxin of toxin-antitoxin system